MAVATPAARSGVSRTIASLPSQASVTRGRSPQQTLHRGEHAVHVRVHRVPLPIACLPGSADRRAKAGVAGELANGIADGVGGAMLYKIQCLAMLTVLFGC